MNRTLFILSSGIFSGFLFGSCSDAALPDKEDVTVPLEVSAVTSGTSVVSRSVISATGTGSGEANQIGVFLTMASDAHSAYANPSISSAIFTVDNAGIWTASRPVNLRSEMARLYAWYPVVSGDEGKPTDNGSTTRTVAVDVLASQTFDGANATACSQTDYLYGAGNSTAGDATAITVNRDNNNPTIWLQHALAQVVFNIEYKASRLPDDEYDFVKSISLQGPFDAGSGTMQLDDGSLRLSTPNATLAFTAESSPQLPGRVDKPVPVAYGLVAPKVATTAVVTVTLVLGHKENSIYDRTLSATTSLFDAAWAKGYRYTYHLLLGKNDLTFKDVAIQGWTDNSSGGSTDMPPVLENTPLAISAEIEGERLDASATRAEGGIPASDNAYDRSTFVDGDKINVLCTRSGTTLASAGYTWASATSTWAVADGSTGLGFLPAITCRAEFPVNYDGILADQSTPAAFLKSNFLKSSEVAVSGAEIRFIGDDALMHQHARLTLNFEGKNDLPAFSQMTVEGTGFRTGGTASERINMLRPLDGAYSWCAVIHPRSASTAITVTVTDGNNVTYRVLLNLASVEQNNNYIYTLSLNNNVLVPVGQEIKPWAIITRYTGNFESVP